MAEVLERTFVGERSGQYIEKRPEKVLRTIHVSLPVWSTPYGPRPGVHDNRLYSKVPALEGFEGTFYCGETPIRIYPL